MRPPSKQAMRDAELIVKIQRVFDESLLLYGADKIWTQLNREGIRVAHCTEERPRKTLGWKTPAEALDEQLRSLQQTGVATTD